MWLTGNTLSSHLWGRWFKPCTYVGKLVVVLLAVSKPLAVLIPLQGLEMAWPFRNGQLFPLAVLIPHQFDIGGQVCSVAFKCNSCNTIKTYIFIGTAFGLLWNKYQTEHITTFISAYKRKLYERFDSKSFDYILLVYVMNMQYMSLFNTMQIMYLLFIYNPLQNTDYGESD